MIIQVKEIQVSFRWPLDHRKLSIPFPLFETEVAQLLGKLDCVHYLFPQSTSKSRFRTQTTFDTAASIQMSLWSGFAVEFPNLHEWGFLLELECFIGLVSLARAHSQVYLAAG